MAGLRGFIKKLQRADDAVKRRFYFGGAFIAMMLVFGSWLVYIQYYSPFPYLSEVRNPESAEEKEGFGHTFQTGLQTLWNDMRNSGSGFATEIGKPFGFVGEQIGKTRDIVIETPEENIPRENGTSSSATSSNPGENASGTMLENPTSTGNTPSL